MRTSRSIRGVLAGVTVALIWQVLGGEALLWTLVFGAVGGLIGYILEEPARLKAFAEKLER